LFRANLGRGPWLPGQVAADAGPPGLIVGGVKRPTTIRDVATAVERSPGEEE
jgi:hypothetical protein